MFVQNKFNNIVINGEKINCNGSNLVIQNGKVVVDGKTIRQCEGNVEVIVNGDVNKLDCAGSVVVQGNSGSIDCGGSCTIGGNVTGNIDAGGSVSCGNVSGDIDAGGSVRCKKI